MNDSNSEAVIRVRNLRTEFGRQVVHESLDLDVRRGEVLGVVGGSGTGKTVLLHSILGLVRPAAGSIEVFGHDLADLGDSDRRDQERRWGVLFQNGALFSSLTVSENVQLPLREHLDVGQRLMDEIAALKLAMVGLSPDVGPKLPAELSGGMKKRVGLARALALDPEVLFLDEPTSGLDPVGADEVDQLIHDLATSLGLTVFMVTHDLDSLDRICDRIAVLAEKRIVLVAKLSEILEYDHPWVQEYFHGRRARRRFEDELSGLEGNG